MVNYLDADFIYDLMTREINRGVEGNPLEDIIPEDEFFEATIEEIYEARLRLCDKMGLDLDKNSDLQIITDGYSDLCRYLCKKMFAYGKK